MLQRHHKEDDVELHPLTSGAEGGENIRSSSDLDEEAGIADGEDDDDVVTLKVGESSLTGTNNNKNARRRRPRSNSPARVTRVQMMVTRFPNKKTISTLLLGGICVVTVLALLIFGLSQKDDQIFSGSVDKSPMDPREYEFVVLPNKMRVLLVSDPFAEKAAASVAVKVGHMSDPENLAGLAHYCEHMLFMGSAKYPGENEYNTFLTAHGGYSNAYTASEETVYYFSIDPSALNGVLDIFAQFFVSPLFSESALSREMIAVDNEHKKNLQSDNWRLNMLQRSMAASSHALHKFGTGSVETLNSTFGDSVPPPSFLDTIVGGGEGEGEGEGGETASSSSSSSSSSTSSSTSSSSPSPYAALRHELLQWYRAHYSANLMSLCVVGRESVSQLKSMVESSFSAVANRDLPPPRFGSHPYPKTSLPLRVTYVPVQDVHALSILWPLDWADFAHFDSKSIAYLSHILGHEGEGSLACSLKNNRKWILSLSAGAGEEGSSFTMFEISMVLTNEGVTHVDEIVEMVLAYVKMLKNEGPKKWIWDEGKLLAKVSFDYQDRREPEDVAQAAASDLLWYPPPNVLSHAYIYTVFDTVLISKLVDSIADATNMMVFEGSKTFLKNEANVLTEKWYGIKYIADKPAADVLSKWSNAQISTFSDLHLIETNPFLPTENLKLVAHANPPAKNTPIKIVDEGGQRLFYLPDVEFNRPRTNIHARIFTNRSCLKSARDCLLSMITAGGVEFIANYKFSYYASAAGLSSSLTTFDGGISLAVGGFSEKIQVFLERIMSEWTNLQVDDWFSVLKEQLSLSLVNSRLNPPYIIARERANDLLKRVNYNVSTLMEELQGISQQDVSEYIASVRCHSLDVLVHGNTDEGGAVGVFHLLQSHLSCNDPAPPPRNAIAQLPPSPPPNLNGFVVVRNHENKEEINSAVLLYMQATEDRGIETDAKFILLKRLVSEPCFNILRTQQQLGYIVACFVKEDEGVGALSLLIQSGTYSPPLLFERGREFLSHVVQQILPQEGGGGRFETVREAAARDAREGGEGKTMDGVTAQVWHEIATDKMVFDRKEKLAAAIEAETLDSIVNFAAQVIQFDRMLNVWILPGAAEHPPVDAMTRVDDVEDFKAKIETWRNWNSRPN